MAFYGVLDVLQRAVSVLLVPVYTRVLSQGDFGNLDLLVTACSFLSVLVDLQQAQGFMRFYPEQLRAGTARRFAGTNLMIRLVLGVSVAALFLLLGVQGSLEVSFLPSFRASTASWVIAVAAVPVSLLLDMLLLQARLLGSRRLFALGTLTSVLVSSVVSVVLVAWLRWGLFGAVVGQAAAKAVSVGLLGWGLRRDITVVWDSSILGRVLRHALPIVPGWWLSFSSVYISRFFLYGGMGAAEAAILALCTKVAGVVGLFSVSFRMAWQPLAMASASHEQRGERFAEAMRLFLVGGLLSICGVAIVAKPVVSLLAPASYANAANYVALFAIASVIGEVEFSLQLGNQVAGRTFWLSVSAVVGFAVNLAVLAALIKVLGIGAVVLGALVSSVLRVMVAYGSSQASHTVRYDRGAFLRFGAGCVLVVAITAIQGPFAPTLSAAMLASIGLSLSWMSLTGHEKDTILRFVAARLRKRSV